ncbi:methyltransferase domain-containing protein [Candidatus Woesearchaeota archaeon]|nr:methyltransferase domain-containing protein [Candidatus Woesearchaeota archaeon]
MKDSKYVKNYFKRKGTVSKWWNPTDDDCKHIYIREIEIISSFLKRDNHLNRKKALELSVGKGRLALPIHNLFQEYLGTDISEEMLQITWRKDKKLNLSYADAENLESIKDDYYDYVFCLAALVHYPHPENAIQEISRVLKEKGTAIVSLDNKYSLKRIIKDSINKRYLKNKEGFEPQGDHIFQIYPKKELKKMFIKYNLKIQKIINLGMLIPIKYQTSNQKNKYFLFSPKTGYRLRYLSVVLDQIPIVNKLSTYNIYILKKISFN